MFCLLDEKGVINKPNQKPEWIGESADGLRFKLPYEQLGYNGTDRKTDGCTRDLFIILALEEEIGIF